MDRPKHRWFIVLGGLLAIGVLLLARQWVSTTAEQGPAPASVRETPAVEPEPDELASPGEAGAIDAIPPAATTGGTLQGRIIDAVTRQPIREFEVRLVRLERNGDIYREHAPITQTFQSTTGRFAWHDLQPSTWQATVSARGYRRFEIDELDIVAGSNAREIVMPLLRGFTVRGRVFDVHTALGIGEALVRFYDLSNPQSDDGTGPYTKSKQDGSFELDAVPGGNIVLKAGAKNYAEREVRTVVSDETPPVDIALSTGGAISGRLVTSGGVPIKGMLVLSGPGGGVAESSDQGEFSFSQLPGGTYTLSATTTAGSAREQVELGHEERRPDVILTVVEGRTVRGTIRGLRPDQLTGAFVSARAKQQAFRARPDEQGAYVLRGLPAGRASLTVSTRGRQVQKTIDVPVDRDLVFDIVFPPGARLSGRVTQDGKPVASKSVVMGSTDPKATTVYQATTSADGQYEIEGVPAGEYRVRADADVSRSIAVAGDTVLNIDIPLVQLGGRVLEEGGSAPIVGADIYVRGLDATTSRVRAYKQSDHFGQFELTGVEQGEVQLTVYKPGYEMHREKISYSAPTPDKTIRLRRGGGVEVRVQRSANGEPEHGLLVTEKIEGDAFGIDYWIVLDRDGIGFLPSALAGSTLVIQRTDPKSIVIREWDGLSLDLKF